MSVSANNYKGTRIGQSISNLETTPYEEARIKIQTNFEKGFISSITYEAGLLALDALIEKSVKAGEGSRGGHVIGHTRSGKPIYAHGSTHPDSKNVRYDGQRDLDDVRSARFSHEVSALKNDKKRFDAAYNNPDVKVLRISSENPLSNQLRALTGDSYNLQDFDETNDAMARVYTHKKTGQKFSALTDEGAEALGLMDPNEKRHKLDAHVLSSIKEIIKLKEKRNKMPKDHPHRKDAQYIIDAKQRDHDALVSKRDAHYQEHGFKKSEEEEDAMFFKGGEGSKGGHVIGHTKSGKPVYAGKLASSAHHKNFTEQDHYDAADVVKNHVVNSKDSMSDRDRVNHMAESNSHLHAAIKVRNKSAGKTKSGKEIYNAHDHSGHEKFDAEDHKDAAIAHGRLSDSAKTTDEMYHHATQAVKHWEQHYAKGGNHSDAVHGKAQ